MTHFYCSAPTNTDTLVIFRIIHSTCDMCPLVLFLATAIYYPYRRLNHTQTDTDTGGKNKELCLCSMFYVAHKYGIHESIRSLPASPLVGSSIRSHCRLLPTTTLVPILSCKPHRTREHDENDLSERLQEPFTLFAIRQQHNNSLIHQPRQSTLNIVVVNV